MPAVSVVTRSPSTGVTATRCTTWSSPSLRVAVPWPRASSSLHRARTMAPCSPRHAQAQRPPPVSIQTAAPPSPPPVLPDATPACQRHPSEVHTPTLPPRTHHRARLAWTDLLTIPMLDLYEARAHNILFKYVVHKAKLTHTRSL